MGRRKEKKRLHRLRALEADQSESYQKDRNFHDSTVIRALESDNDGMLKFGIQLIKAGVNKTPNAFGKRLSYDGAVLKRAVEAEIYEGMQLMQHQSGETRGGHVVRRSAKKTSDIVGQIRDVKFNETTSAVEGLAYIPASKAAVADLLNMSIGAAKPIVALSLDQDVKVKGDGDIMTVTRIGKADSLDIVRVANAGGAVQRALESEKEITMKFNRKILEWLAKTNDKLAGYLELVDWDKVDELDEKLLEKINDTAEVAFSEVEAKPADDKAKAAADADKAKAAADKDADGDKEAPPDIDPEKIAAVAATAGAEAATKALESAAEQTRIDGMVRDRTLRWSDDDRAEATRRVRACESFDDAEKEITAIETFAKGHGRPYAIGTGVVMGKDQYERACESMTDLIGQPFGREAKNPFGGLHEAYREITGNPDGTTDGIMSAMAQIPEFMSLENISSPGNVRALESVIGKTATFAVALGDSVNKIMLEVYNNQPHLALWNELRATSFFDVGAVDNFKPIKTINIGTGDDLTLVNDPSGSPNDDNAYTADSDRTEETGTFYAKSYGKYDYVSRMALKNDDVGAIQRVIAGLSEDAARSFGKFVENTLIAANPTAPSGNALFHASNNNLQVSKALSDTNLDVLMVALRTQTEVGGQLLGLMGTHLCVPAELEKIALEIVESTAKTGQDNPGILNTYSKRGVRVIVLPGLAGYQSDGHYFMIAANTLRAGIIIRFIDGNEAPQVFRTTYMEAAMFDGATDTSRISDSVYFKVRHEYGGMASDHRVFQGGTDEATW